MDTYDAPPPTLGKILTVLATFGFVFLLGGLVGYVMAPAGISHETWKAAQAKLDTEADNAAHEAALKAVWNWLRTQAKKPDSVELDPARSIPAH